MSNAAQDVERDTGKVSEFYKRYYCKYRHGGYQQAPLKSAMKKNNAKDSGA